MRSLALAAFVPLLVNQVTRADEPRAQSAAVVATSNSDVQDKRSEEPIAEQYAQLLAEHEAWQTSYRQPEVNAPKEREKRAAAANRFRDLIADFSRRMVDLAESSPADSAARDALLWVIDMPDRNDHGAYATNSPGPVRYSSATTVMTLRQSGSA